MKKKTEQLSDREVYIRNRNDMLEDFKSSLEEVQKSEPSIGGIIAGMDFQDMAAYTVFNSIIEQEEYIKYTKKYKPDYVVLSEEQEILKDMIAQAKSIYKEEYNASYKMAKKSK